MTTKPNADEVVTQGHKRYFYQLNGAGPNNPVKYGGQDGQYLAMSGGVSNPKGDISSINVQNPAKVKSYRRVGNSEDAPDFPTSTIEFMQFHGAIPRQLYNIADCITTLYEITTACKDPSDFINGATDYIKILSNGQNTNADEGGGAFDSDDVIQDDLDMSWLGGVYTLGTLDIGEKAGTAVSLEVIDVTYGNRVQCKACGPDDDGTKLIYAVTDGVTSSAGSLPSIIYSTDGGATWTITPITTALATDTPVSIDVIGQNLVVTVQDGSTGGYYVSEINQLTGVPGTFTAIITTGFVASNQPNDVYVASPREVFFCGDNGYIYKTTSNILSGVSVVDAGATTTNDLKRIHGFEETVVSVGASDTAVFSLNRGTTWTTATTATGGGNTLQALQVQSEFLWWVGDSGGNVYYTENRAESAWSSKALPATNKGNGTISNITDIVFVNDEVGYILGNTSDPAAEIFYTWNGGTDLTTQGFRAAIALPTADRINRIAFPVVDNQSVAANNIVLGGLAGDGTDGVVLLGIAGVKG